MFPLNTPAMRRHSQENANVQLSRFVQMESPMKKLFARFMADETASTAIEYALIAGGISIVIIAAVRGIGSTLNNTFANVNSQLR